MRTIFKRLSVPAALIVAVFLLMPSEGVAQIPLPILSDSPTPTPTPTPKPSATKTATPKPKPSSGGGSGGGSSGDSSGGRTSTTQKGRAPASPTIKRGVAAWLARPKTPARTTTRLLRLLADVKADGSTLSVADMRGGFGRFPILGYVWYQDDFGAPRYIPYYHPHSGTDLFASQGTPVSATTDGVIMKKVNGPISGNALWLRAQGSRAYFFYGHLYAFAPGIRTGARVRRGDVIGYVGATGDAVGTPPHVHFEIHPTGSPDYAANPKPYLDAWLSAAETRALGILGYTSSGAPKAGLAPWTSFLGSLGAPGIAPPLWSAALDGSLLSQTIDASLARLLAGHDLSALTAEGVRGSSYPLPSYGRSDPLAALFRTSTHAD